jgi:hypothetical protein
MNQIYIHTYIHTLTQDDEDGNSHEDEDEDAGDGDWLDDLIGDESPKKTKKDAASKQQGLVLAQGSHVDLVQMDIVFRDGKYSSTRDVHAFLQVCVCVCVTVCA